MILPLGEGLGEGIWVGNRSRTEEEEPLPGQPQAGQPLPKGEARNAPSLWVHPRTFSLGESLNFLGGDWTSPPHGRGQGESYGPQNA